MLPKTEVSWKIGGEAGFGLMLTGSIFAKVLTRLGFFVFSYPEYPSLIRGGHNSSQVRFSLKPIRSAVNLVDLLVALNLDTINRHKMELVEEGGLMFDGERLTPKPEDFDKPIHFYSIPFLSLAKRAGGDELMRNSVAVGASVSLLGLTIDTLYQVMADTFGKKKADVVKVNQEAARLGFEYAKEKYPKGHPAKIAPAKDGQKRMLIAGNEAVGFGMLAAGCRFYTSYPMTPTSSLLHFLAQHGPKYGMVVRQGEDEIGVVNSAIGASFAGVRSACASSGGGFSLMIEAYGLAGMTETPLVVIEGQRPGPSTGLPTWTEQADLRFVLHAAQGDFPRIVLAPGDIEECFYLVAEAFNLAERYQTPVVVMTDKFLAESQETLDGFDFGKVKIDRGMLLSDEDMVKTPDYKRYQITASGISPRGRPGQKGAVRVNSDEHDEKGFSTEEAQIRVAMMDKRMRKLEAARKDVPDPIVYGPEEAEITLVGWGSVKGPVLDALALLEEKRLTANFLHFNYLNPFPAQRAKEILATAEKTLLVEGNATAQLGGLVREKTGIEIKEKLLKYDGRPHFPEEIVAKVEKII